MTNRISSAVGQIAESATLAVDSKAKALKAAGHNVIGFGAGEPDFATPAHIVESAIAACADTRYHRYSPAGGLPELKEALSAKTMRDSGLNIPSNQFLVTNGGKQAVFNTMMTLLDQGDEVLLPAPYWTTYPESIRMFGGVPVEIFAGADQGFRVTVEQLEAARNERTKALVFVSPSNPTGAVYPREEIEAIGRWAVSNDIWVITDEIYEHLVYGDAVHYSMPVVVPEILEKCVVLNGVAKTYAMTGWRVGWMAGPSDVIKAASNMQSHATSNVCNVAQVAATAAVGGGLDDVNVMRTAFDERRLTIHRMLNEIEGVECLEPQGAFYAFPSLQGLIGRKVANRQVDSTLDLATIVLEEANVAFVPGEAFGAPGYARFSFALGIDDLVEGINRVTELVAG
ncbi:MAG: pyridoxal phosphate-dependent aminotransferase [Actinomycetota bacterium]|jgi:aspartate/methionine/tyrosine aminotransferase|nr:pyridoxal phosphate-dependent aminotransferase [Actinomycetota bacterium]|tara:strand:- start:331 stop:1527 length:1197 start_codon:yes stop_codon:yes gene_type:complete